MPDVGPRPRASSSVRPRSSRLSTPSVTVPPERVPLPSSGPSPFPTARVLWAPARPVTRSRPSSPIPDRGFSRFLALPVGESPVSPSLVLGAVHVSFFGLGRLMPPTGTECLYSSPRPTPKALTVNNLRTPFPSFATAQAATTFVSRTHEAARQPHPFLHRSSPYRRFRGPTPACSGLAALRTARR